jgi:hypothetical protein
MKTWSKSLQATRDGRSSSAIAEDVIRPACLDVGRETFKIRDDGKVMRGRKR